MNPIDQLSADLTDTPATADDADRVRDEIVRAVGDITTKLTKYSIGALLGCQSKFVAESATGFAWSPPLARGTIVHKAIELWVYEPDARAVELVEWAIRSVRRDEYGIGQWLDSLDRGEMAEVKALAATTVAAVHDTWPKLDQKWQPISEMKIAATFGRVSVAGAVDLSLGAKATRTFVDWKTGRASSRHSDDMFLYAFLETIRTGTPPKNVATAYIDRGALDVHPITAERFEQTGARIIAAARVSALLKTTAPTTTPSPACRWCPLSDTCEDSTANESA